MKKFNLKHNFTEPKKELTNQNCIGNGSQYSTISSWYSTLTGGRNNTISSGDYSFIGDGHNNTISSGDYSFIGDGHNNTFDNEGNPSIRFLVKQK